MKNKIKLAAAVLAVCCISNAAYADEHDKGIEIILVGADTESGTADTETASSNENGGEQYIMTADTVYEMDLEGDGKTEQISYKTYDNDDGQGNCNAVLEIYKDGELFWTCTDSDWSYYWDLAGLSLADGTSCLLATSRSDNDWNPKALVLSMTAENDTLTVLADLTDLTRQSEENTGNLLSGWARTGYPALLSAKDNTVTVPWTDTLKSTGNMTVYVDYEITGDTVIQQSAALSLDEQRVWTAWHEFDVYDAPESENAAFHVSSDDTVRLTELTMVNGKSYLKCVNEDGEEGWFPDAEEYIHIPAEDNPEEYYQGYFKECIFAG